MPEQKRISIIGIGDDGLDGLARSTRKMVEDAALVIGDERTLKLAPSVGAERFVVGRELKAAVDRIADAKEPSIAILVYGDPLFYGWTQYLCDKLGKDSFEIVPHVSCMQLAFARLKESWDDAYLTDVANHPLDAVIDRIRTATKVGLFTSSETTPSVIAQTLLDSGIDYFSPYVCENLGTPNERVTRGTLSEIATQTFAPLNVMVLLRDSAAPDKPRELADARLFGNPDEAFLQSRPKEGLLTSAEVRAMALAQLAVQPDSVVWDIGAGSGSVSVEAAMLARDGHVFAIEMDPDEHELIRENAARFGVTNLTPVLGRAPDAWADLPDPQCVFVAGTGREIARIVTAAFERLTDSGRLVANVGSIENLADLHATMSRCASDVRGWMVNIARGTFQLERIRFGALNPTFLLSAIKRD